MVYIAYFTELILQICDYAQKRRICRENCKYALDERFHGHFCPRRKPAKSCHPAPRQEPVSDDDIIIVIIVIIVVIITLSIFSKKSQNLVSWL